MPALLVAFSDSDSVDAEPTDDGVELSVDGDRLVLSRAAAAELRSAVGDALTERQSFGRTTGVYRSDGSYVVERRAAETTGNSTVFESFDDLWRVFDGLPERFVADDLDCVTGSRRHMLVWHFVEHPGFPASLAVQRPLTAEKGP
ncbi:DUF7528 family protein [Halobacterium jilantaiense]|uniref:Uncharacterized protein n=1 Tax=Halobacterium jilantaiense TaxID=355548 RepID=A0A1I0N8I4_9EURY|nr:hypothetical protein [Halobacterium jilantaiense]SEV96996.1 hypothetical protein SAMN04487945_0656 [Halobacterium jilantaiense]